MSTEQDPLRRVQPHDVEAEMSVLGSGFIDPESVELAREIIDEDDFYREAHRLIWRSQCDLTDAKQPIDAVTVLAQLNGQAAQIGGAAYVAELAGFEPTARNVRAHAKIVREKSTLRNLSTFGTELAAAVL